MSDYISRQAAIEAITNTVSDGVLRDTIEIRVNDIPAADVVEVVRCNDCKWWKPFNDIMGDCGYEMRHKDFYCKRGEKK